MASVMEQNQDVEKKIAEAKKEAIAKKEKEKGRKLTQKELAEIDRSAAEANKMALALKKCVTMAMTVEFTSATDVVTKQNSKVDEEGLKTLGLGWLKRKALKAALAMAPKSETMKYEVKGNMVIFIDKKDRDTLTLGDDGQTLSGYFDKDTKFMLKRTK
jgi:hypothetical protein